MNLKEFNELKERFDHSKARLDEINKAKENVLEEDKEKLAREEYFAVATLKLLEKRIFLGKITTCSHHIVLDMDQSIYYCTKCGLNNSDEEVNVVGDSFTLDYLWNEAFPNGYTEDKNITESQSDLGRQLVKS